MRWARYVRISEDRTGEEWGVARQLSDVEPVIRSRDPDAVIVDFVENDVSAYKRKPRPKFTEMMDRAGEFDYIVAKHTDRLLRRGIELEEVLERCEPLGTVIITTHDGVDTSTEYGRMVARILVAVAQGEVERKKARQISAGRQAAERGKWTGGRRPFGYEADGVTIRDSEADLVRLAYAGVLSGRTNNGIAREWNEMGITSTLGHKWSGSTLHQMLIRERYAGLRTYHGEIVGVAEWDPVVDEETWRATVSVLTHPSRKPTPSTRKYLLTGLMLCGKCEKPIGSAVNPHPIYKCKHCGGVSRDQRPIDRLVTKLILGFLNSDDVKKLRSRGPREEIGELRARERLLLEKIDQLAVEREQELLTARQVKVATDRVEAQLREISDQIERLTVDNVIRDAVGASKEDWDGWSLDRKRAIIGRTVELRLHPAGKRGVVFNPKQLSYRWLIEE